MGLGGRNSDRSDRPTVLSLASAIDLPSPVVRADKFVGQDMLSASTGRPPLNSPRSMPPSLPPPSIADTVSLSSPSAPACDVDAAGLPPPPAHTPNVLPSIGSKDHGIAGSSCKPCAFYHTKGCSNGMSCQFCHSCGPEAIKRGRKQKLEQWKALKRSGRTATGESHDPEEDADSRAEEPQA